MTTGRRLVIGLGALLVAARVFFPASMHPGYLGCCWIMAKSYCGVSLTATMLHAIGVGIVTWVMADVLPWPRWMMLVSSSDNSRPVFGYSLLT